MEYEEGRAIFARVPCCDWLRDWTGIQGDLACDKRKERDQSGTELNVPSASQR